MALVRPGDDAVVAIEEALAWQREHVLSRQAPVSAAVLTAVLDDCTGRRVLASMLPTSVRFGDLPALRVLAAVHGLALRGLAPAVARHAPTLGGSPPAGDEVRAFEHGVITCLADRPDVLASSLAQTPQTNETGRSALLRCALSRLPADRPVRLREIGCSAGLNLRADHLPGHPGLEAGPLPPIVERMGCDLDPIDPLTEDGALHLAAYVWMDDVERFTRLWEAIDVARAVPAVIEQADAVTFLNELELERGHSTVIWHSAMWVYVPPEQRRRIRQVIAGLGAGASEQSPLVHVSWEWAPEAESSTRNFQLVTRTWRGRDDDGSACLLATGDGHGRQADLVAPRGQQLAVDPLSVD